MQVRKCISNSVLCSYLGNYKASRESVLHVKRVFNFTLQLLVVAVFSPIDFERDARRKVCKSLQKVIVKLVQR
jgi:hypothetical protein